MNDKKPEIIQLEDRILFDVAPMDVHSVEQVEFVSDTNQAVEFDWSSADAEFLLENQFISADYAQIDLIQSAELTELATMLDSEIDAQEAIDANIENKQLIVLDRSVDDFHGLIDLAIGNDNPNQYEILLVDSHESAIERINERFATSRYSSVHIVAHGQDGEIRIGNETWDEQFLIKESSQFALWQTALSSDADLQIYGCNVAESEVGREFVHQLANLTGTDVAASDDLTGSNQQGGDWDLEFSVGDVANVSGIFNAESVLAWNGTLDITPGADVTTEGNNGGTSHDAVAVDQFGNYVVTWTQTGADADIFAQVFNFDGTAKTGVFQVNETAVGDQQFASVSADANGNFVIVWTDTDLNEVFAKTFFADGSVNQNEFLISSNAVGAAVAMNDSGQWAVTWEHSSNSKVFAEIYNTDGSVRVGTFTANDNGGSGNRQNVSIDMNSSGDIALVWDRTAAENDVHLAKFNIDGFKKFGGDITVANSPLVGHVHADVTINDSGEMAVSMTNASVTGNDIAIRMVNADGSLGDAYSPINSTTAGSQVNSSIDMSNDGDFVVTWEGNGPGDSDGVFYRIFDSALAIFENEVKVNDHTLGDQSNASAFFKNKDELMVVYSGDGDLGSTIYVDNSIISPLEFPTGQDKTLETFLDISREIEIDDFGYSDFIDDAFDKVRITKLPDNGVLKLDGVNVAVGQSLNVAQIQAGKLEYEPNLGFFGNDTIDFKVIDIKGYESVDPNSLTIDVADYQVELNFDNLDIDENSANGTLIGTVAVNDFGENETYTYSLVDNADGRFAINQNGELLVNNSTELDFEEEELHTIEVRVEDSGGARLSKTFIVNVDDVNEAPTAVNDTLVATEDTPFTFSKSDILAGDTDPEKQALALDSFEQPNHGTLTDNGDGTFTYVPFDDFDQTDSFQYVIKDAGGLTAEGTVFIEVTPVNDRPIAQGEVIHVESPGDTVLNRADILANDIDVDGDDLQIIIVRHPKNGTLSVVDGKVVYTPNPGFDGIDRIRYRVTDGELVSEIVTLKLKVNFNPIVVGPDATPVDEAPNADPDNSNSGNADSGGEDNSQSSNESSLNSSSVSVNGVVPSRQSNSPENDNNDDHSSVDNLEEDDFGLRKLSKNGDEERYKFDSSARTVSYRTTDFDINSRFRSALEKQSEAESYTTEDIDYSSEFAFASMSRDLDMFDYDFKVEGAVDQVTFATLSSITSVLTVGYVLWMVRGGMLMASFVSSIPAWQSVDPLNIVEFGSLNSAEGDDESLESIVNQFTTNI